MFASHRVAMLLTTAAGLLAMGGPAAAAAEKNAGAPAWELKGSRIIACCCAAPCPCRINKPPMHCHGCDFTTAVTIETGHLGPTRMDGVTFTVVGRSFGEKAAANWNYVYVADTVTDAQLQALQELLASGTKALGAKAPYVAGKSLGLRRVPMTYTISADGRDHNCEIPGILELKTRATVLPGHQKPVTSAGIFDNFGDSFVHAECLAHSYKDATIQYAWELTGRQANQADFTLNEERLARGGIGWGCWSAHADLGARDKYQEQLIGHDADRKSCCDKK